MAQAVTLALTSIPPRFSTLRARLLSLLAQRPGRICLTIPHSYHRFADWDGCLPDIPPGIEVLRAEDRGPATKFLTAVGKFPNDDILIADDDCDYGSGWMGAFRAARTAHPDAAIAASTFDTARLGLPAGHRIVQGFAGVLIPPGGLGRSALYPPSPDFWVDDIWISARLAAVGIEICDCREARTRVTVAADGHGLQDTVIETFNRAALNCQVAHGLAARFGIWSHPA